MLEGQWYSVDYDVFAAHLGFLEDDCRWGTLRAPHRPYYREVGLGNKAHSPIAKKNTEQSNVQDQNSNSDYTRKGARSIA